MTDCQFGKQHVTLTRSEFGIILKPSTTEAQRKTERQQLNAVTTITVRVNLQSAASVCFYCVLCVSVVQLRF